MRLVPLLVDSAMNMNEEMNAGLFLSLLTPRSFFETFSFVEPRACGPPLSVDSIGWICQVKENVRSSKDGASPIYRSRSGAKTNTPATYCTGPSTRHSTFVESEPRSFNMMRRREGGPPSFPHQSLFPTTYFLGCIAQLVEHWAFNLMVAGSSPAIPKPALHSTMSKD